MGSILVEQGFAQAFALQQRVAIERESLQLLLPMLPEWYAERAARRVTGNTP